MNFKVEHHYDVPAQKVFEMFERQEFWQAKYEALGQKNVEVLHCGELDGGVFRIRTQREVPVNVPSFAKKVLSPFNTIIQTDEWLPLEGNERSGSWALDVQGKPISMNGSMQLVPDGEGSCNLIEGTIDVKVRLVGGMVAKFLAGDVVRGLDDERSYSVKYLSEKI